MNKHIGLILFSTLLLALLFEGNIHPLSKINFIVFDFRKRKSRIKNNNFVLSNTQ